MTTLENPSRTVAERFPLVFVTLSGLALILCQLVWRFILPGLDDSTRTLFEKISSCLLAILLLGALNWWRKAGFGLRQRWRTLLPFLPLAVLPLLSIVFQLDKFHEIGPGRLAFFALVALMTGFAEEAIFRGLAIRAFLPQGMMKAAVLSALIFGLLHFANLMVAADPLATALQVVFAILFGFACASPLLYTGWIWPLVIIHAIQDFVAFWTTGGITEMATPATSEIITTILLMIPFAAYGFWLIRRREHLVIL